MEREFSKLAQSDWRWTAHPEEEWLKEDKDRRHMEFYLFIYVCCSTNVYFFYGNVLMASWFLQVRIKIIYRPIHFGQFFGEVLTSFTFVDHGSFRSSSKSI